MTGALALLLLASAPAAERWAPAALASDQYESSPTFTPDGREIVFMRSDPRFETYRLLTSRCESGGWTAPRPVGFAAPAPFHDADPFVTLDGSRLYFVSTRPAPGRAKDADDFDVWVVERTASGWGEPVRLPEPVNSTASELLPRADAGGRLLFGSARPGGLGQGDIYRAARARDGSWRLENLGAPVNSAAFEYEADLSRDGRTLLVLADRGDRSHLYRFALEEGRWVEKERIPAYPHVFQVGPLLSPKGDRLLFAQADGQRSGEMFVIDLAAGADRSWPPACPPRR